MQSLEATLSYFPKEILNERESKSPIRAYNAGIFGGANIAFFKEYTEKAFEFVDKNISNLSKISVTNFNIFFEQYLFYCLAKNKHQNVNVLLSEIIGDNQYKGFGDFARVSYEKQYLHLLGTYKKREFVCAQMANRLRQDYPIYYYRIIELFKKNEIPLLKNYYFFVDDCSQKNLIYRNLTLKQSFATNTIVAKNSELKLHLYAPISLKNVLEKNKETKLNKLQLKDLTLFCKKINEIVKDKFSLISNDYLYGRDLNANCYFQYLFEHNKEIYTKKIIKAAGIEVVNSQYEWTSFIENNNDISNINLKVNEIFTTVITPECHSKGFSINNIDALDVILLEIITNEKTVKEVLDELEVYFDKDDLKKSKSGFEKLIFGRIKLGFHIKSIQVLF